LLVAANLRPHTPLESCMSRLADHRLILAALAGAGCWAEARAFCRLLADAFTYAYASDLWRDYYGRGLSDEDDED